jgi:transposase
MGRRLALAPHLTSEELKQRYKSAKGAIERGHYQVIWLLQLGKTTLEVAEMTGYSRAWIYEVVKRYNRQGPQALGDQRQHNPGHGHVLLNDVMQALLYQALQEEPPEGGFWNGRKVADWLSERLGRPIHRQRGWELLKQMGFSLKVPRPNHEQSATDEEQRAWEKNLHEQLKRIQADHPDAAVELWAMDEHRLGLHPVLRRLWVDGCW